MKNKIFYHRLRFALSGLTYAFKSEKSLRIQSIAGIAALLLLGVLRPEPVWWAIIVVMIAMVLAAEMFNTAIEFLCDYIQPDHNEVIGRVKDVSAGAVLITSFASVIVALFMLIDTLLQS